MSTKKFDSGGLRLSYFDSRDEVYCGPETAFIRFRIETITTKLYGSSNQTQMNGGVRIKISGTSAFNSVPPLITPPFLIKSKNPRRHIVEELRPERLRNRGKINKRHAHDTQHTRFSDTQELPPPRMKKAKRKKGEEKNKTATQPIDHTGGGKDEYAIFCPGQPLSLPYTPSIRHCRHCGRMGHDRRNCPIITEEDKTSRAIESVTTATPPTVAPPTPPPPPPLPPPHQLSFPPNLPSLEITDALSFFSLAQTELFKTLHLYTEFFKTLLSFKSNRIGLLELVGRVSIIFHGRRNLIDRFNAFLPEGFKIHV